MRVEAHRRQPRVGAITRRKALLRAPGWFQRACNSTPALRCAPRQLRRMSRTARQRASATTPCGGVTSAKPTATRNGGTQSVTFRRRLGTAVFKVRRLRPLVQHAVGRWGLEVAGQRGQAKLCSAPSSAVHDHHWVSTQRRRRDKTMADEHASSCTLWVRPACRWPNFLCTGRPLAPVARRRSHAAARPRRAAWGSPRPPAACHRAIYPCRCIFPESLAHRAANTARAALSAASVACFAALLAHAGRHPTSRRAIATRSRATRCAAFRL